MQYVIGKNKPIFTLEEHVFAGGFGAKVLEWCEAHEANASLIRRVALPDEFIEQGTRDYMFDKFGLSPEKVTERVLFELKSKKVLATANL